MAIDRSSPEKVVASYCAAIFAIVEQYHSLPEAQRDEAETFKAFFERGAQVNADHFTRPHQMDSLGWPSPYDAKISELKKISDDRFEVHTNPKDDLLEPLGPHHRFTVERKGDGWRISAEDSIDDDDGVVYDLWRDIDPRIGQLFDEHVGSFFDKQDRLAGLIGEENWSYDTESGLLSFGRLAEWHAQILGTESQSRFTWRWSWANQASGLPERSTQCARAMRAFGEKHRLVDFTTPGFPCGVLGGWKLMMIACGLAKAPAAYRAPQDENLTVFMLIDDPKFPTLKPGDTAVGLRIATIFPQALEQAEEHPRALEGYLRYYGLTPVVEKRTMRGMRGNDAVVTAHFDELKRLTKLEA
jgi:hypothetical protein